MQRVLFIIPGAASFKERKISRTFDMGLEAAAQARRRSHTYGPGSLSLWPDALRRPHWTSYTENNDDRGASARLPLRIVLEVGFL